MLQISLEKYLNPLSLIRHDILEFTNSSFNQLIKTFWGLLQKMGEYYIIGCYNTLRFYNFIWALFMEKRTKLYKNSSA